MRSFLPLAVLVVATLSVVYSLDSRGRLDLIKLTEHQNIDQKKEILNHEVQHAVNNLKMLARNQFLHRFIEGDTASGRQVVTDFFNVLLVNGQYNQIRFLDVTGQERVRVDRQQSLIMVISDEYLQNKADRYYFQETIGLPDGGVYLSRLDLNIEQGVIERPFKPTLRISAPIVDSNGINSGVVVINYSGDHILGQLADSDANESAQTLLLDHQSYYLLGLNKADEWGFMFADKQDVNFKNQFPLAWQQFNSADSGQFIADEGLFTFQRFCPVVCASSGADDIPAPAGAAVLSNYWFAASFIAAPVIHPWILASYISGGLILLVVLAVYSWNNAKANCQRMLAEQQLKEQATRDPLTGLANRHLFYERASQVLAQSQRMQRGFAVLFIDLDKFKQVNDELGHEAGDALLLELSRRMRRILRKPDTVARFGGDEFVLLIPEMKNLESVYTVAKKVISSVSKPFTLNSDGAKVEASVGASIGISTYPENGEDIDTLITAADAAMYQAKSRGTGNFRRA